jgi:uncharacterized protein (TIGR04255 family)
LRKPIPKKLKHDAIAEATFEIRFDDDPGTVPEIVYGRLADAGGWQGYQQTRLPTADIPAAFRRADPDLRRQPAIRLVEREGSGRVLIGPQMLAFGRQAPYPGWTMFSQDILKTIQVLFRVIPAVTVTRLGLRYINAFRSDVHGIAGMGDLDLSIQVDASAVDKNVNLHYRATVMNDSVCNVRIATKEFAQGSIPENTTVLVDVDVSTPLGFRTTDRAAVEGWVKDAHESEKEHFFKLLKLETIENLRDDS